jgi:hypothetical protein
VSIVDTTNTLCDMSQAARRRRFATLLRADEAEPILLPSWSVRIGVSLCQSNAPNTLLPIVKNIIEMLYVMI